MGRSVEKGYEKYAWIIVFVFGLLTVIAAPINLRGTPPNPPSPEGMTGFTLDEMDTRIPGMLGYIYGISRQLGNFMLAMGVLLMAIAAIPYKKGEKWAWYACWIIPVLLVIQIANSLATGGFLWQFDFGALVVFLAGLFLPFRKFFPKQQGTSYEKGKV